MFSDISSRVQENLAGVRMVRAFVQEKAELRRFEALNREYIGQNVKLVLIQGLFQPLLEALIGLTFLVVLLVGGYQVLRGRITVGSFVMFNTYMGRLVWPMIALGCFTRLASAPGSLICRPAFSAQMPPSRRARSTAVKFIAGEPMKPATKRLAGWL